jgi:hypothetical protein
MNLLVYFSVMKKLKWVILVWFVWGNVSAQPYFDIAGLNGWNIIPSNEVNPEEYYCNASLAIPIKLDEKNILAFTPFYERRFLETQSGKQINMHSTTLPVTFLTHNQDTSYSISLTFIARSNSTDFRFNGDVFQVGSAVVNTVRINNKLKLKFGLYYNREFFSDFFIPLAGLEWKINGRTNLFGVFPNLLKFEYRLRNGVYTGVTFKSITNSYRIGGDGNDYYKIEDNHFFVFTDINLPGKFVLGLEAGHTIFRKFNARNTTVDYSFSGEGFILKAGLSFRIRLY